MRLKSCHYPPEILHLSLTIPSIRYILPSMATATKELNLWKLAKSYEDLTVQIDLSTGNYMVSLRTHVLLHRVHTNKTAFRPHSFYNASWVATKPTEDYLKALLKEFRKARRIGLDKGIYQEEVLISGDYQMVDRKYNQWFYWNSLEGKVVGELHKCPK